MPISDFAIPLYVCPVGNRAADTGHLNLCNTTAQVFHLNIKCATSKKFRTEHSLRARYQSSARFPKMFFPFTKKWGDYRIDVLNDQHICFRSFLCVAFVDTQIDMIGNFMSKLIKLLLTL